MDAEGLLEAALQRADELGARLDPDTDDGLSPILLAVSDNGSQMIASNTRTFMAMVAIAQHFGRPSTPQDQGWIELLNKTIKYEYPHLMAITDPAVLRAELDIVQQDYTPAGCTPASASTNENRAPAFREGCRHLGD